MMSSGMMGGMVWASVLSVLLLLGFAYIVWVLSSKETGTTKSVGQLIAALIALIALVLLLYGTVYGGVMGKGALCDNYKRGYRGKSYKKGMHKNMQKYMEKKMIENE